MGLNEAIALLSSARGHNSIIEDVSLPTNGLARLENSNSLSDWPSSDAKALNDYPKASTTPASLNNLKDSNEFTCSDVQQYVNKPDLQLNGCESNGDDDEAPNIHGTMTAARMASTFVGRVDIPEYMPKLSLEPGDYLWENQRIKTAETQIRDFNQKFNADTVNVSHIAVLSLHRPSDWYGS